MTAGTLSLTAAVASPAMASGPTIVANNAAFGGGPIQTFDFSAGGSPLGSFVPDGASGSSNGRALEVIGSEVFYTELSNGFGPSDAIHVAPYNGGAGGADTRTLPNPRPGVGIQDLAASGGALYALTGYGSTELQVFKLDPASGGVLAGPITIASPASGDSDGFAVLPNGHFLINVGDAACTYDQYDGSTGALVSGTTIVVPSASSCTGVDTDGTSLFFATDFSGFTQTDMSGNVLAKHSVSGSNTLEDISLVQAAAPVDTPPNKPDAPSTNQTENADGNHTVSWSAVTDSDGDSIDHYVLQRERSDQTSYSDVANVTGTSYHFGTDGSSEGEGRWTYRVIAVDSNGTSSNPSDASGTVLVDKTNPNAPTSHVSPAAAHTDGSGNNWFKDSVTASFTDNGDPTLADGSAGSGVASVTGSQTFDSTDVNPTTGAFSIGGTVTDNVGNASSTTTVAGNVDWQTPSTSFSDCPTSPVLLNGTRTAHWGANDPGPSSGLATTATGTVSLPTSTVGPHTVSSPQPSDNVGHTGAAASCTYSVVYQSLGLFSPAPNSKWKLGQTVPLKTALADANGARISDSEAAALASACRVKASSTGAQPLTGQCMKYDSAAHQFIYNWNLSKTGKTGADTVTVTITYPNTTTTTTTSAAITITT